MDAKQYLQQIADLNTSIDLMQQEIIELKNKAISLSGSGWSDVRVQTSRSGDAISNKTINYVDKESEYEEKIEAAKTKKNLIVNQILDMPNNTYKKTLYLKYVKQWKFCKIAMSMRYETDSIKKIHRKALADFGSRYL